ncbi:MAG: hypothetical protein EAZ97_07080 [Bacteroidetes bacterium]|nr:MAG: hypothetical protein EAZ97_07080 [Bacteroidota bacterium]
MKNKIYFSLILIFFQLSVFAQSEGNFRLSLAAQRVQYQGLTAQSFGLNAEYYVNDWVSLGYYLGLGFSSNGNFHAHFPMGVYAAAYPFRLYLIDRSQVWAFAALLAVILPETINIHFRASQNFHISPFISPLGIDYWRIDDYGQYPATFSTGLRLNVFKEKKYSLAPYAGFKANYKDWNWGLMAGAMVGISF